MSNYFAACQRTIQAAHNIPQRKENTMFKLLEFLIKLGIGAVLLYFGYALTHIIPLIDYIK